MAKKLIGLCCAVLVLAVAGAFLLLKEEPVQEEQKTEPQAVAKKAVYPIKPVVKEEEVVIKKDLYSATPYDLPLISITEIAKLPDNVKKSVDEILESAQGFYYLKYDRENEKVFIILQNPIDEENVYSRHGLQFAEVTKDGEKTFKTAGFEGDDGETANAVENLKGDLWEFDRTVEPARPIKHIKYKDKHKIEFVETWNYSTDEPVKYQMKNSKKKVISVMKETFDNESNYRREHVFYDDDGNTRMSISVNYDGANISRFTYYDSEDDSENVTIISEYEDGVKIKESIYNEDYELLNTVECDYTDDVRDEIRVFDKDNHEVEKIN